MFKYFNIANKNNCRVVLGTKTIDGLRQSAEWMKKICANEKIISSGNDNNRPISDNL